MNFRWTKPHYLVPRIAVYLAGAMSGAALLGWLLNVPALTTLRPGLVSMKANTAIGFVLLAAALYCSATRRALRLQNLLALIVALLSVLTLLEYLLGVNLGIDEAFFRDPVRAVHPGRMSAITAGNFMLLAIALLLPRFRWSDYVKEFLGLVAILTCVFAIVGYVYGVPAFYGAVSGSSTAMAVHTGVCFLLLAIGFLFLERDTGLVRVFDGDLIGSMVARYLVPVAVLVPVVLGVIYIRSRWNIDHPRLIMALSVVSDIVLLVVLIWIFAFMIRRVEIERALVQQQAETDRLTGIYNRRYFENSLEAEMQRARRYGSPLSLLMIDVDGFKQINDRYGHLMGDRILRRVVRQCESSLRATDVFCRFGGEEFAIIAPETVGPAAVALARRIRESVAGMRHDSLPEAITISVGVAAWEPGFITDEDFIAAADAAVYLAKSAGRNCECLYMKQSTDEVTI